MNHPLQFVRLVVIRASMDSEMFSARIWSHPFILIRSTPSNNWCVKNEMIPILWSSSSMIVALVRYSFIFLPMIIPPFSFSKWGRFTSVEFSSCRIELIRRLDFLLRSFSESNVFGETILCRIGWVEEKSLDLSRCYSFVTVFIF